ncbi:MAG: hypothetical protein DSY91_04095 [Deltaproteobacteria bacterium]|nr:MAG: hypothetical protein DSY91_04095 [Deltaproteobacteria bacterium]
MEVGIPLPFCVEQSLEITMVFHYDVGEKMHRGTIENNYLPSVLGVDFDVTYPISSLKSI